MEGLAAQEEFDSKSKKFCEKCVVYQTDIGGIVLKDKVIGNIINGTDKDVLLENANQNSETPSGLMYKLASETSKEYTLKNLLSKEAADAVKSNLPIDLIECYWFF